MPRAVSIAVAVALGLASGCHWIATWRQQAPLFQARPGTRIALVRIDTIDWCPGENIRAMLRDELIAQLDGSRYVLVDRLAEDAAPAGVAAAWENPAPVDVSEPLVLVVEVGHWPCRGQGSASIKLTFQIRTRDGRTVETQTAAGDLSSGMYGGHIYLDPNRPEPYAGGTGEIMAFESGEDMAPTAIALAVDAFVDKAYKAGHIPYSAIFSHDDLVDAGVELAKDGRFPEAVASWEAVLRREPGHAAALFDIGMVLQLQGRDRETLVYFEAAFAHGGSGPDDLYVDLRDRVRERLALVRDPVTGQPPAWLPPLPPHPH